MITEESITKKSKINMHPLFKTNKYPSLTSNPTLYDIKLLTLHSVTREFSKSINTEVGMRLGSLMSPWVFKIFINHCTRELKATVGKAEWSGLVGIGMSVCKWHHNACREDIGISGSSELIL